MARTLVEDVMRGLVPADVVEATYELIRDMKFIPGGRYLYYAGRPFKAFNNCFLLRAEEDTREDWASLSWKSESCLMTGGGIGIDYSVYRGENQLLSRTGGLSSGPLPKMKMINEIGRHVMQGGSRRSAIYASLDREHADAEKFLAAKDWDKIVLPGAFDDTGAPMTVKRMKELDFNYPAPLDMTNISVNYSDEWLALTDRHLDPIFLQNVRQALRTGEPGFSFNFGAKRRETLRNACTEVTSEDDSDVCNLGSVNMGRITGRDDFMIAVQLGTIFLLCGTLRAHLPYEKVDHVRSKNRRLGLGLMGVHEWLIRNGLRYEVGPELREYLCVYEGLSDRAAFTWADKLGISRPVAVRAIAPTGTIGMVAGTSTGIEPLFAVAYMRRYLKNGTDWHYQYVIDATAKEMIDLYGVDPDSIETASDLAADYERRIRFQAEVQDFVDMSISSTINLPEWGSALNNEDKVEDFARALAKYAPRLRGFTAYPDGSRGGQPLTVIPYREALGKTGVEFREHDICEIGGKGGVCGA